MKNLIILILLLFVAVGCKAEKAEEAAPVVEEAPAEVTPAVEEVIEEVTE